MAIPPSAKAFDQALDPSDVVDFYVLVSQGKPEADSPTVLLIGEAIASYQLALSAEASAVGLRIVEREGYANRLSGNVLTLYLEVDVSMRGSAIFDGSGVIVAIEMLIVTTSAPPRTKQRSFLGSGPIDVTGAI
jgi:hypothetical protein